MDKLGDAILEVIDVNHGFFFSSRFSGTDFVVTAVEDDENFLLFVVELRELCRPVNILFDFEQIFVDVDEFIYLESWDELETYLLLLVAHF